MQQTGSGWLLGLALAALTAAATPVLATASSERTQIDSFSGAYLAARVAEVDNDLDSAIVYFTQALKYDGNNEALQQSLLVALISQGRFDEAIPYAEKLKAVPEAERFSRLALGVDAFRKADYIAAETWLKLALESDLDRLISSLLTAWAKSGAGETADALAYLENLQGPVWYGLFATYHRALIAENAGLAEEAKASYAAALEDDSAASAAPETWLRAAEAYAGFLARRGDKEGALAVLDKAEEFSFGRLPLIDLRQKVVAQVAPKPLVDGPRDGATEVLFNLGTALNRGGGEQFVRLYLHYALALKPDSDVLLLQLASVAEQQGRGEEAIGFYGRIPADSPYRRAAELQLGLNLADLDRDAEAITHLKALLESGQDDMRAYIALGGVYASDENYRAAADLYEQAVARLKTPTREDWNVFYQRGIALERLKEWPKAEASFRKALELFPDQPQVMNYLGYSWVDMNMNLEEGLGLIRKAADLRPSDGYIIDSLGWAYYRLGRWEDAVRELERAVSLKPDDAVLNDHLGDAYWRAGRRLEATFQWSHSRDMKPEPDVLAGVQKKLAEGLPPLDGKAAGQPVVEPEPKVTPEPGDRT